MIDALPNGLTRAECIEGLRWLRDYAVEAEQAKDPTFDGWPDADALLDFIEAKGFPTPEGDVAPEGGA